MAIYDKDTDSSGALSLHFVMHLADAFSSELRFLGWHFVHVS